MRVFVADHLGVEVAVARRRGSVEEIHLDATRRTVATRGEVRIVDAGTVLHVGQNHVVIQATATEVVLLEIARAFREAQIIQFVVHPVAPVEELHRRGVRVVRGRQAEVEREIKDALPESVDRGLRAGQIRPVIRVAIQMGVHVVAARLLHPVVDPAERRGGRVHVADGEQLAGHQRRLGVHRRREARRHRRGTVAGINAVEHLADFHRQFAPHQHLARLRVDDEAEAFLKFPPRQFHLPAQAQRVAVQRQPDQTRLCVGGQRLELETLLESPGSRPRVQRGEVGNGLAHARHGEAQRLFHRDGGSAHLGRAPGRAEVGGPHRFRDEQTRNANQFPLRAGMGHQHRVEHRDAIHLLLPGGGAKALRCMVADFFRVRQHLGPVPEQGAMFVEK